MTAPKISLYSLSDLRTTLDDHLPIYLSTSSTLSTHPLPRPLRFTPSHTATHIHLGLGYAAVAIAAYTFYLDYVLKRDFADVKTFTTYAVIIYFALNGLLTLWIRYGERGLVFAGYREGKAGAASQTPTVPGKTTLRIRSHAPHRKYNPVYRITASWTQGDDVGNTTIETTALFTRFFAADGSFVPGEFEAWLRKEIPMIAGGQGSDMVSGEVKAGGARDAAMLTPQVARVEELADEEDDDVIVVGRSASGKRDVPEEPIFASGNNSTPGGQKRSKRKA